ncbi:hypothetical protein V6N12_006381 [Hibiscus sabdariffa]|uniref:Uncharacterized protein n=1 Tax=Hibiscus sabdariffa TaxID=183260 RepID=A0ABR2EYN5_9ROSI
MKSPDSLPPLFLDPPVPLPNSQTILKVLLSGCLGCVDFPTVKCCHFSSKFGLEKGDGGRKQVLFQSLILLDPKDSINPSLAISNHDADQARLLAAKEDVNHMVTSLQRKKYASLGYRRFFVGCCVSGKNEGDIGQKAKLFSPVLCGSSMCSRSYGSLVLNITVIVIVLHRSVGGGWFLGEPSAVSMDLVLIIICGGGKAHRMVGFQTPVIIVSFKLGRFWNGDYCLIERFVGKLCFAYCCFGRCLSLDDRLYSC